MADDEKSADRRLLTNWLSSLVKGVLVGLIIGSSLSPPRARGERRRLDEEAPVKKKRVETSCFGTEARIVDRAAVLRELNPDTPAASQTGPKGAYLFAPWDDDSEELIPTKKCETVDVLVTQSSAPRCVLFARDDNASSARVFRREMLGGKKPFWDPISRIRESKQRMPNDTLRNRARALAARLLGALEDVNKKLKPLLEDAAKRTDSAYKETMSPESKGAILVMCINAGNLDLLLNFVASTRCHDIDENLVVFAADPQVETALKAAEIRTFRHDALGDFKADAARSYGDHQFTEIMWLKITCVFLVNNLGYDILFQDADLVWWRNPWPYFAARPDIDTFWMDDGARTSRFAPHFPNTGYYLIRSNPRTRVLNNQLLGGYATVLAWQSHQALVSQVLAEVQASVGLTVHILDKELFPSGKQFHHNRPLFERIHAKEFTPFAFHMCWTAGKDDKLKFLKAEGLWFLPDRHCDLPDLLRHPDAILTNCLVSTRGTSSLLASVTGLGRSRLQRKSSCPGGSS